MGKWKTVERHIKTVDMLKDYAESAVRIKEMELKYTGSARQETVDEAAFTYHDYQEELKKLLARFEHADPKDAAKIMAYLLKIEDHG